MQIWIALKKKNMHTSFLQQYTALLGRLFED